MIVDTHCHLDRLDLSKYQGKLELALQAAKDNDVTQMLCVCIDLDNFANVLNIADKYSNIHSTVGIHPNEDSGIEISAEQLVHLAQHPKVIGIGETGLDYFRSQGDLSWQQQRFRHHIRAAKQVNKPLIVHTRQARADTLKILREEQADKVQGIMHCFTEDWATAQAAMELGFYISFSGIVTFPNAKDLQEVVKKVPLDRLLVETDAPYLAPVPYRGKPNEPAYVRYVVQYIAALKQIDWRVVAEQTTKNYFNLFKLS